MRGYTLRPPSRFRVVVVYVRSCYHTRIAHRRATTDSSERRSLTAGANTRNAEIREQSFVPTRVRSQAHAKKQDTGAGEWKRVRFITIPTRPPTTRIVYDVSLQ